MLSLSRIGPLITAAEANEFVELKSAEIPVEAIARMSREIFGRRSGHHRVDGHLLARCNVHSGYAPRAGVILPTTSSGLWLVPFSIASTFSCVGMMIGMKSVIPLSR